MDTHETSNEFDAFEDQDPLEDQGSFQDEDSFEEQDSFDSEFAKPEKPKKAKKGRTGTRLLFFLAFAFVASGITLAAAPQFSWRLTSFGSWLTDMGIEHGVLILSGVMLLGVGIAVRSRSVVQAVAGPTTVMMSHPTPSASDDADLRLVTEQIATEMAQMRTNMMQITEEIQGVAEAQRINFQRLANDAAAAQQQQLQPNDDQTALFGLAASLDKLNAKMDERFHGLDVQFRSRFDSVTTAVEESRASFESHLAQAVDRFEQAPPAHEPYAAANYGAPAPAMEPMASMHPQANDDMEVVVDLSEGEDTAAVEFFETVEEIDQIVTEGRPQTPEPQPPFPSVPATDALDSLLPDDAVRRAVDQEHGKS